MVKGNNSNGFVQWVALLGLLVPLLGAMFTFFSVRLNQLEAHTVPRAEYREDRAKTDDLLIDLIEKVASLKK